MKDIIKSASKIVFIMMAITACATFAWCVFRGLVVFDVKDFMVLTGMAFGYYFASKGPDNTQPYAGK